MLLCVECIEKLDLSLVIVQTVAKQKRNTWLHDNNKKQKRLMGEDSTDKTKKKILCLYKKKKTQQKVNS